MVTMKEISGREKGIRAALIAMTAAVLAIAFVLTFSISDYHIFARAGSTASYSCFRSG